MTWGQCRYHQLRGDAAELARLRRDFPRWGFLLLRHRWVAIRGSQILIVASSATALRAQLPPPPADPSFGHPDEPGLGRVIMADAAAQPRRRGRTARGRGDGRGRWPAAHVAGLVASTRQDVRGAVGLDRVDRVGGACTGLPRGSPSPGEGIGTALAVTARPCAGTVPARVVEEVVVMHVVLWHLPVAGVRAFGPFGEAADAQGWLFPLGGLIHADGGRAEVAYVGPAYTLRGTEVTPGVVAHRPAEQVGVDVDGRAYGFVVAIRHGDEPCTVAGFFGSRQAAAAWWQSLAERPDGTRGLVVPLLAVPVSVDELRAVLTIPAGAPVGDPIG